MRHSAAHVMARAVMRLFEGVELALFVVYFQQHRFGDDVEQHVVVIKIKQQALGLIVVAFFKMLCGGVSKEFFSTALFEANFYYFALCSGIVDR